MPCKVVSLFSERFNSSSLVRWERLPTEVNSFPVRFKCSKLVSASNPYENQNHFSNRHTLG